MSEECGYVWRDYVCDREAGHEGPHGCIVGEAGPELKDLPKGSAVFSV